MGRRGGGGLGNSDGDSANPFVTLTVLLLLGIGLGVLHNRLRAVGRIDPALAVVRTALYPFQRGGSLAQANLTVNWDWLVRGRALEAENVRLAADNARLKQENETLRKESAEIIRLRAALKLVKSAPHPLLAATVVGLLPSPHFDTIIVSRGSRDGIHEKQVIRTPDGLVGQVIDVGPFTSEVMLLSDLNSGVGALVRRGGKLQGVGIVQGMGRDQPLELQNLKRELDIKPGDVVVSSGLGGVFPAEIPLGTVTDVKTEDARFLKTAHVAPAVPLPGDLREVLILP